MRHYSSHITIAFLAIAAAAIQIPAPLDIAPLERANLILLAGIALYTLASALVRANDQRLANRQRPQRYQPSSAHLSGWKTRRSNESVARQKALLAMQDAIARHEQASVHTRH